MAKKLEFRRRGVLPWPLEWLLLAVATANVLWSLFDLSYLRLRDYYVLEVPQLVKIYDPLKGIEPHELTDAYLKNVELYKEAVAKGNDPRQEQLLATLRAESTRIIEDNPFLHVDKQGKLEQIKNRIRLHMFGDRKASARGSFDKFWSSAWLTPERRVRELDWFDKNLSSLFAVNYYRSYAEDGDFTDWFFLRIDLWFMAVFLGEYILRTLVTRWQEPRWSWGEVAGENAFDLLNLLPAVNLIPGANFSWLVLVRVFTYGDRLQRMGVFPSPIAALIHRYSSAIAEEVTDLVVIKVLSQIQDSVREADFTQVLPGVTRTAPQLPSDPPTAIDGFVKDQTRIVVTEVLPQVRPELEKLLTHSVRQSLPLPGQIANGIARAAVGAAYGAANGALKADPEGERLTRQLLDKLLSTLGAEWREHGTARDAQEILVELLEQAKRDYIQRNNVEPDRELPEARYRLPG